MFTASGILWAFSAQKSQGLIKKENHMRIIFAGLFLGLHFALFFVGVRNTSVASATLLANTGPLFTATMSWFGGKKMSGTVFIGLVIAVIGVVVVQGSALGVGEDKTWGNILSLLSGFCIAVTYMFASQVRESTDNSIYGRSVFLVAAITIAVIVFFSGGSLLSFEKVDVPWFLFLGIVPSILGHNMLNYSIRYISPTAVASIPLGEPIIASIFGYILFFESVPLGAIYGAPFVFFGLVLIVNNSFKN
jgi:drug/metabolite transporter (DMT)-like permease